MPSPYIRHLVRPCKAGELIQDILVADVPIEVEREVPQEYTIEIEGQPVVLSRYVKAMVPDTKRVGFLVDRPAAFDGEVLIREDVPMDAEDAAQRALEEARFTARQAGPKHRIERLEVNVDQRVLRRIDRETIIKTLPAGNPLRVMAEQIEAACAPLRAQIDPDATVP